MRAAVPPFFCTSAMACRASVVFPLLSGPYTCTQARGHWKFGHPRTAHLAALPMRYLQQYSAIWLALVWLMQVKGWWRAGTDLNDPPLREASSQCNVQRQRPTWDSLSALKLDLFFWTAAQGSYTPPHKYREVLHKFEKTSNGLLLGHSYTLVWTPLIFMMLPLPNRALTSFNTDSRAFACKWQAVLRAL